mmetsp:Transcript_65744/g.129554  ORF Transcript_65744/g.129554 Transcript_65744/m.129554 type:complete len:220 (+) Transcript_65744:3-662(+)
MAPLAVQVVAPIDLMTDKRNHWLTLWYVATLVVSLVVRLVGQEIHLRHQTFDDPAAIVSGKTAFVVLAPSRLLAVNLAVAALAHLAHGKLVFVAAAIVAAPAAAPVAAVFGAAFVVAVAPPALLPSAAEAVARFRIAEPVSERRLPSYLHDSPLQERPAGVPLTAWQWHYGAGLACHLHPASHQNALLDPRQQKRGLAGLGSYSAGPRSCSHMGRLAAP